MNWIILIIAGLFEKADGDSFSLSRGRILFKA
jgi:hypothetical protein